MAAKFPVLPVKAVTCVALLQLTLFMTGCGSRNTNRTSVSEKDAIANRAWKGQWIRSGKFYEAGLTISNIAGDSLQFEMNAVSGGNTGELEGKAKIEGSKAHFYSVLGDDTCAIEFALSGDSVIAIDQTGNCFAGMGVEYSGRYINSKRLPADTKNDKEDDEVQLLDDPKEDSLLTELIKERRQAFISSAQLSSEDEDLDSLGAKVQISGVRGLYTIMENIIMINASKNIWAAVIDNDTVYYFTNSRDYAHRLPKTIENWRSRFQQYPVVYKTNE